TFSSAGNLEVPVRVSFPSALKVDTLTPKLIQYKVTYSDPKVKIDSLALTTPNGWKIKDRKIESGSLTITLENISGTQISNDQYLGTIPFIAYGSGIINLESVRIDNDCKTFFFSCFEEGKYLQKIQVDESGVNADYISQQQLLVYPNPSFSVL